MKYVIQFPDYSTIEIRGFARFREVLRDSRDEFGQGRGIFVGVSNENGIQPESMSRNLGPAARREWVMSSWKSRVRNR